MKVAVDISVNFQWDSVNVLFTIVLQDRDSVNGNGRKSGSSSEFEN